MKTTLTELPTGLSSVFLLVQSSALILLATWALGGRLDGAILWISALSHASLLALLLDRNLIQRLRLVRQSPALSFSALCFTLLVLVLWAAPFNASGEIQTDLEGNQIYQPLKYLPWLPSTFIQDRCRDYGMLLSGVLIQCSMLWLYLNRLSRIEGLLKVITGNAITLALIGAGFRLMGTDKILGLAEPVHPSFFASFRYHNHWTAYAILAMGSCLALTAFALRDSRKDFNLRRQRPEIVWIGALFLLSLTLPMTAARAGVLLLALFWLYLGAVLTIQAFSNRRIWKFNFSQMLVPFSTLGLVTIVIGFAIWSSAPRLQSDWEQTKQQWVQFQGGEVGDIEWARTDSWGDGWRMFKDSPVWGWGFGSHRYLYQLYARDEYRTPNGTVKHIKEFAHNDWMQYLAELGAAGCFFLIAPACLILWLTRRFWIRHGSPSHWLIVAILLILFLASFEFPLSNPAVLIHFGILLTFALKIAWLEKNRACSENSGLG